jgi:hypothetical protein
MVVVVDVISVDSGLRTAALLAWRLSERHMNQLGR